MSISSIVIKLKKEWSAPKSIPPVVEGARFEHYCKFGQPAEPDRIGQPFRGVELPSEIVDFWQTCNGAELFAEANFGQWGLRIFSYEEVTRATDCYHQLRLTDWQQGDLIVGKFIGDSELLLLRCDSNLADFGHVVVVRPIDPRPYWVTVADNFHEFFQRYANAQGEKYWEISRNG